MKKLLAVTVLFGITSSFTLVAQEPAGPPPQMPQRPPQIQPEDVVRITTNLVQVDAVITDKNGRMVTDLKANEVQIFEDGKPQEITNFTYNVSAPTTPRPSQPVAGAKPIEKNAPPVPTGPLTREQIHRTIAIIVDDLCLSFESTIDVKRALKKFVNEQIEPGDLVALIRTRGSIGGLQQYTSDKRQLTAAIEGVRWNPMCSGSSPVKRIDNALDLKVPETGDGDHAQKAEPYREEIFSVGTLGAVNYVVRGLRELPGRKSVLLVSDGLKIFNPDDLERSNRVQRALEALTDLANRASVVIYTMDARGLLPLGLEARDNTQMKTGTIAQVREQIAMRRTNFYESQNGLNYLAEQTGGLAIRNKNDLSAGIKSVMDDQRGYYLIGYRPDESTFDVKTGGRKFHNLSLKVTRPGKYNVRMRNGFFGLSDDETKPPQKTAAQQLLTAISSPFVATGINLQLTSLFGNDVGNGSFLRSLLHIDATDLTFKDGPNGTHESVFDVLAMTFGNNGVPVDYFARTYTIQLPEADYRRAIRQGLVYNITTPVKQPGSYQFRMSIRDAETDRVGSAGQFIEVPNLSNNRLALSGIVLNGTTGGSQTGAIAAVTSGTREGANRDTHEASPAIRRFKHGMQLEWGYLIYNARLDKTTQKPQVTTEVRLFRDGQQVFSGGEKAFAITNQTDLQRLVASGALILGTDLTPGEYVLQLVVKDALADKKFRTATQWMDFEILK